MLPLEPGLYGHAKPGLQRSILSMFSVSTLLEPMPNARSKHVLHAITK